VNREYNRNWLFLEEGLPNYLQFLKVLFLCESHLRFKGSILQSTIKKIFEFTMRSSPEDIDAGVIISQIFTLPCLAAR
jgi:hypothetical protein